jgi:hypothetical protein
MISESELKEGGYYLYYDMFVIYLIKSDDTGDYLFYFLENADMQHLHTGGIYSHGKSIKIMKRLGLDSEGAHCLWIKSLGEIYTSSETEYQIHKMLD